MIDVSVVVVSYNVRELLGRCLRSLAAAAPGRTLEILVVDNGSSDGTVETVQREFPDVTLIANAANRGFTAANNQATAVAHGTTLLYLNPDTEVRPGALEAMLAHLEEDPHVGVVGPRLSFPDGRTQSSRRRFPTPLTALVESTIVQRWWPACPVLDWYYVMERSDEETQDVDWLYGACLLVRRDVIETVGAFDERFFMYSEEVDLCRRIRDRGWRVVYVPAARVVHYEGRSSEQDLARRAQNFHESKCRYVEKHFGPSVGRALRIFLLAQTSLDLAEEALKLALGHRVDLRRERVRNLAQVVAYQWHHLGGAAWPARSVAGGGEPCE